ncbi:hypothetical protein GCM10010218_41870 [Streptomyces mashuensis]|uniref:DUF5667 domain-containing protein n=1 Tax=Streptomyces mashuensis TaxID=33904 RepID=A0A919B726_9ACTN|nr:DUF5667 domain-containing protein [Streptomyces mashuensis]GHF56169.1 hypothetical protein GCM10010218_41870 [Streptomyces mashuensis]
MIANVSAHRRANAFAQALEDQDVRGAEAVQSGPPAEDAEQGKLLALANGLGALPSPELDPEVKTVQRAQLIAAMEAQFASGAAVPPQRGRGAHRARALSRLRPRSRWSKGLAAGGLTVGVAAGAFGGVATASSNALPGDTLYGLKRGMEDLRLDMAEGDSAKGGLLLDQASTRLQEARRLMERDKAGRLDHESLSEIRRTLAGMQHDAAEGHRLLHGVYQRDGSLGAIQRLSSFTASHQEAWSKLRSRLPVQLADVGDQVTSVFAAIDSEVEPLRPLLRQEHGKQGSTARPDGARQGHPGATERSAPASQAPPAHDGKHPGDKPRPASPDHHDEHDGLLGGTGLLQPPSSPDSGGASHAPRGRDGKPGKQPDVVIPPVLPDILPGLGIHGEDDR